MCFILRNKYCYNLNSQYKILLTSHYHEFALNMVQIYLQINYQERL